MSDREHNLAQLQGIQDILEAMRRQYPADGFEHDALTIALRSVELAHTTLRGKTEDAYGQAGRVASLNNLFAEEIERKEGHPRLVGGMVLPGRRE